MKTYIVLLRGVMPTGKNKVSMAVLRDVLSESGYKNVRTYIASGNVLVDSQKSTENIEHHIKQLLKNKLQVDLCVVVRTNTQIKKLLNNNPFYDKKYDQSRVFYVSYSETPKLAVRRLTVKLALDFSSEKLVLEAHGGYMYIPGDASRSKLSNNWIEKKLEVSCTTRNANTLNKLLELAEG